MKVNRIKMIKKITEYAIFYAFNWKNELRQLCVKTSWSTLIQNLFLRGPALVISWTPWFWSNASDFQMKFRSECCFILVSYPRQQKSVRKQKKTWKKCRSNWSLVRLVCARIGLWSDLCAPETASDQTVPYQSDLWTDRPRTKLPLIRPSQTEVTSDQTRMRSKIIVRSKCARSRLWSGEFQTEVTPDQTSSRPLSRRVPDHCPD